MKSRVIIVDDNLCFAYFITFENSCRLEYSWAVIRTRFNVRYEREHDEFVSAKWQHIDD